MFSNKYDKIFYMSTLKGSLWNQHFHPQKLNLNVLLHEQGSISKQRCSGSFQTGL
jgi:hypothetical protein